MLRHGWGDDTHNYYVLVFNGRWTSEDCVNMLKQMYQEISQQTKYVSIMMDFRHSGQPPLDILHAVAPFANGYPRNIENIVMIANTNLWKRLYQTIMYSHNLPIKYYTVRSVDEAYQLLIASHS